MTTTGRMKAPGNPRRQEIEGHVSEHENERQQPYPSGGAEPPPPYGQPPYGQPPYGQPGGQSYGQPPYGQPGGQSHGQTGPEAYPRPAYGTAPNAGEAGMYPEPSQAVLALVLGIIGMVAFQLVAPFAWVVSHREIQAIDQGRRNPVNRGLAVAGKITGIIGTVLLALGVLVVIVALLGLFAVSRGG